MDVPESTPPQSTPPQSTPPQTGPGESDGPPPRRHDDQPILPAKSRDETDIGWGDYADSGDDDRLLRDRPPHWDNA